MTKKKSSTITFKLDELEEEKLLEILRQTGMSKSNFFRQHLMDYDLNKKINEIDTHLDNLYLEKERIMTRVFQHEDEIVDLYYPLKIAAETLEEVNLNKLDRINEIASHRTKIVAYRATLAGIEKELLKYKKIFIEKEEVQDQLLKYNGKKQIEKNRKILIEVANLYKSIMDVQIITNKSEFLNFLWNSKLFTQMK